MILAPWHIERIPEIEEKYQKAGINTIKNRNREEAGGISYTIRYYWRIGQDLFPG